METKEFSAIATKFILERTLSNPKQIQQVLELLVNQECTIPFVTRYRKDKTGNCNEIVLREIYSAYEEWLIFDKRQKFILETLTTANKLNQDLKHKIDNAKNLTDLEDLYAPFKLKKITKAQQAEDAGLGPIAEMVVRAQTSSKLRVEEDIKLFKEKKIEGFSTDMQIKEGIKQIILHKMAHDYDVKNSLRNLYWREGKIFSSKAKTAEKQKDLAKFKEYFDYRENLASLRDEKNVHRYLAIRRGSQLRILKIDIEINDDLGLEIIYKKFLQEKELAFDEWLKECAQRAYKALLRPALDAEMKTELKKIADEAAISVFGVNLKNLLLQPYLGPKPVLGLDPGIKTGVKAAIVSQSGELLVDYIIYLEGPHKNLEAAQLLLEESIRAYDIKYIAIGNGTFGRETLEFVENHVKAVKAKEVNATLISESGASIYSTSELANKEFPDKDATVRSSVSIARRFQDPLAELVKIDPKSIGVGQYQHDVNQVELKKSLEEVVESCVNYVGVDANTASPQLLTYVSGIGPATAEELVHYRAKHGKFKTRKDFLKISRFSKKTFEQSAGFLRIYEGDNFLDSTFVHPEHYLPLLSWCEKNQIKIEELAQNDQALKNLEMDEVLQQEIGSYAIRDVIKCLKTPSQDPRTQFKTIQFSTSLKSITDVKTGEWYNGVVTNMTQFGCFVDIGIKEKGLLHVSEMANTFVKNAMAYLKVGQEVNVKVIEVDVERKRISLSRRVPEAIPVAAPRLRNETPRPQAPRNAQPRKENSERNDRPTNPSRNSSHSQLRSPRPVREGIKEGMREEVRADKRPVPNNTTDRPRKPAFQDRPRKEKPLANKALANALKNFKVEK